MTIYDGISRTTSLQETSTERESPGDHVDPPWKRRGFCVLKTASSDFCKFSLVTCNSPKVIVLEGPTMELSMPASQSCSLPVSVCVSLPFSSGLLFYSLSRAFEPSRGAAPRTRSRTARGRGAEKAKKARRARTVRAKLRRRHIEGHHRASVASATSVGPCLVAAVLR